MTERRVKTAIIGMGRWGKNLARELNSTSNLAAYASQGSPESAAHVEEAFPSLSYLSVEEIATDTSIEAVAIATPIRTHAAIGTHMLEAGKHTFIEKPLAETREEAERLITLARQKNLVLMSGYIFVHHPVYKELKRRVANQTVQTVSCIWRKYGTFIEDIEMNLLTHHLSLFLDLLGEPVQGAVRRGEGHESDCDNVETTLTYANDVTATSSIDRAAKDAHHSMTVTCADGTQFVWEDTTLYEVVDNERRSIYESTETALQAEMEYFIGLVRKNAFDEDTGTFGLRVLALHETLERL